MRTRSDTPSLTAPLWSAGLALLLFWLLFAFPILGFWRQLALTTTLLGGISAIALRKSVPANAIWNKRYLTRALVYGPCSAVALYGIFATGKHVLLRVHGGSEEAIRAVYTLDGSLSGWRVALLLLLVVSPCEELFWRGYIQRRFSGAYGWKGVALTASAYTAAHLSTLNPVLILAAAVCGTFWGLLFWRYENLLLNIISHALWTTTVFSLAPLMRM